MVLVPGAHDGMSLEQKYHPFGPQSELSPDSSSKVEAPESQQYDHLCRGGYNTLIVGPDRQLVRDYTSCRYLP